MKVLLTLIKRQLLDLEWNLKAREHWIKEDETRLVEWSNKDIRNNCSTIKGCLVRISKKIN